MVIRDAIAADAEALLAIYSPFVRDTAVSFELQLPSVEEFRSRIAAAQAGWAWLVAEEEGTVTGYAYGSSFRSRPAYRFSAETSAYVHPDYRRQGIAKRLYADLIQRLGARGYCNAYAGIALPNEASVSLHQSIGFTPVGVLRRAGWKFGAWHDVSWWQLQLREAPPAE